MMAHEAPKWRKWLDKSKYEEALFVDPEICLPILLLKRNPVEGITRGWAVFDSRIYREREVTREIDRYEEEIDTTVKGVFCSLPAKYIEHYGLYIESARPCLVDSSPPAFFQFGRERVSWIIFEDAVEMFDAKRRTVRGGFQDDLSAIFVLEENIPKHQSNLADWLRQAKLILPW